MFFPQQVHMDAVTHFWRTCWKFLTKNHEILPKLRNIFSIRFFFGKNWFASESLSGSVNSSFDNHADIFLPEACFFPKIVKEIQLEFWKILSNCSCYLRKKIPGKVPPDMLNAILTIGWSFFVKVRQFSAQVMKKIREHLIVQKICSCSENSFGDSEAFLINMAKKFDKVFKIPLKIREEKFIGLFFGRL